MTYPVSELRADLRALDISAVDLAAISGVRLPVIRAWMDGQLAPCDNTIRAVLRALQSARVLRLPVMLSIRRALFHVAERSGIKPRLLRRLGSKMAGDGIWYARNKVVKPPSCPRMPKTAAT